MGVLAVCVTSCKGRSHEVELMYLSCMEALLTTASEFDPWLEAGLQTAHLSAQSAFEVLGGAADGACTSPGAAECSVAAPHSGSLRSTAGLSGCWPISTGTHLVASPLMSHCNPP